MASEFLLFGLTNAVIAVGLAALLSIALKWRDNAQLAAVLWTLILVKFVSPPLAPFSMERPWDSDRVAHALTGKEDKPAVVHDASNVAAKTVPFRGESSSNSAGNPPEQSAAANAIPGGAVSTGTTAPATTNSVSPGDSWTVGIGEWFFRPEFIATIWLGGSIVALTCLIVSGLRFSRLLRCSQIAHEEPALFDMVGKLCRRWNLRRAPRLRVVDARISPMLWTWLDGTTLVIPRSLVASLSAMQREMMLAHELAHFRRGDHLCRWLEAVVQSLYWWLPAVPWVRRRLHTSQEACCDAFVRQEFPDQGVDYCDALLKTSTWLQGIRPSPLFASELRTATSLKRRMQRILEGKTASPVSRRAFAACIGLGLAVCIVSVRWVHGQPAADGSRTVETEFLVTGEGGVRIESGKLRLRGYYDNGDFFEQERPVERGRATFEFQRSRLRELRVSISTTGYLSHAREFKVEGTKRGFAVAQRFALELKPGVTIGGKVVDDGGRSLAGVHVFLSSPSTTRADGGRDYSDGWFQTDADGKWACPGVPPDMRQLGLRLEHATHVTDAAHTLPPFAHQAVKPDEVEGLRVQTDVRVLRQDPPLMGTIVDPKGKPIPVVTVDISGRDPDWYQHFARGLVIKSNPAGESACRVLRVVNSG